MQMNHFFIGKNLIPVTVTSMLIVAMNLQSPALAQDLENSAVGASFETEYQWFDKRKTISLSDKTNWIETAWQGERIQTQLLVDGLNRDSELEINLVNLTNGTHIIDSESLVVYYPYYVKGDVEARNCDGYPGRRPLIELTDALFETPNFGQFGNNPAPIWLSIDLPDDITAGVYTGILQISVDGDEKAVLSVSFHIQDWKLPSNDDWKFYLNLWQFPTNVLDRYNDAHPRKPITAWSDEHYALLEPTYRYLDSLGQISVTTHIKEGALGAPSMVKWMAHDNGSRWTFDYEVFDRHVEQLAQWGIDGQIDAFSPVGWNKNEIPFWDMDTGEKKVFSFAVGSREANAIWNVFLTDFERHLRQKGWFRKTVLYMDEISADEMEKVIGLIRFNNPEWKIGLAYSHEQPSRVIGALYDVSGIFETEQRVETYQDQVASFYTSCTQKRPNVYVAANGNPADVSAMAWYALMRGYDGYLRWAFDRWTAGDPLDLTDGLFTAGDGAFVYRGATNDAPRLVRSVRSELLRDGIEDYEKVRIMREYFARCENPSALAQLTTITQTFTTDGLANGDAQSLVVNAKSSLDRLGRNFRPPTCQAGPVDPPGSASQK